MMLRGMIARPIRVGIMGDFNPEVDLTTRPTRRYHKLGFEPGAGGMQQLVIWYWKSRIAEFEGQGVA